MDKSGQNRAFHYIRSIIITKATHNRVESKSNRSVNTNRLATYGEVGVKNLLYHMQY